MGISRVRERMEQADTWLVELFLSLYTLVWGLGFLNPLTDTFAGNPTSYSILSRIPGGENAIGGLFTLAGLLVLAAVLRFGRFYRGMVIGGVGVLWLLILIAIGVPTRWAAGGIPHFCLVVVAHWYCWARLHRKVTG